tara:strand:- start:3385 stop:3768 length:384 start_codon:yes stop_codon:yes gene_type:complete
MQNNKDKYSEQTNFGLMQMYPPTTISSKDTNKQLDKQVDESNDKSINVKQEKKKKKKKKIKLHKCYFCNKRLNITEQQMTCKCGANFCPKHRLQQQHNCPLVNEFDEKKFKQKCGLGGGKFKQLEVL